MWFVSPALCQTAGGLCCVQTWLYPLFSTLSFEILFFQVLSTIAKLLHGPTKLKKRNDCF